MKILILEDNPYRIEKLSLLLKNQDIYYYTNVKDAIHACKCTEFQGFILDHDLDNKIWVDSEEENTGYTFVKKLIELNLQKEALIYIISMNPIGANRMLNLLLDNGYDGIWMPFHLLKFGK